MPPINQQGSRQGPLITALVIFAILFVVSAVFAFNYYARWQQEKLTAEAYTTRYNEYLTTANIENPSVQALKAAKAEQPPHFQIVNSPSVTAMDVALAQVRGLSAVITGASSDQPAAAVADSAADALKQATNDLKGTTASSDLTGGGLISAVGGLTTAVKGQQRQIATITAARDDAVKQVAAKQSQLDDQLAATDKAAKAAAQAAGEQQTQLQQTVDAMTASVQQLQKAQADAVATNQNSSAQSANQVADAQRQVRSLDTEVKKLRDVIGRRRASVEDATLRVADGQLIRVPGNNVCYIDLGYGSGVTTGLTFEVYDKNKGVPGLPPNAAPDEQLPVGKASIEIVHVGQNSSECRIVKTEPGQILTEGDLIENLVYDAHQKYKFVVYGNFDLAQTGRPSTADADVIKRLVTQWGGSLQPKITPETDFLVLGSEPVVPEFSRDDLTPENQEKQTRAQDALDKYQEVRQQAKDLHIPVLNQNRFLYYVGYYDQAKR